MSTEKNPPKQWWNHMHYVAFSRCTSLQGLNIVNINEAAIGASDQVKHYLAHEKKVMQLCYMPTYNMHHHLNVAYNNVGSIHHKWPAIGHNCNIIGADVIMLTETWLSPTQGTDACVLAGFQQYRQDSSHVSNHRGLLMYIKNHIKPISTSMTQTDHLEMCRCDVPFQDTKLQIVGIYKPPTTTLSQFKQQLHDMLMETDLDLPLILLGDCNLDVQSPDHPDHFVQYMMQQYNLHQHITQPTTWAGTCIDLIFSNCPGITTYALANTWSSHHVLISSLPM
jgi:hypothetical protein